MPEMERKDKLEKAEHQIAETEAKFMEQVLTIAGIVYA